MRSSLLLCLRRVRATFLPVSASSDSSEEHNPVVMKMPVAALLGKENWTSAMAWSIQSWPRVGGVHGRCWPAEAISLRATNHGRSMIDADETSKQSHSLFPPEPQHGEDNGISRSSV